ncbi:cation:proton antiporter [Duganella phyllosphaerae]|uniref:K(+)/H(+) antiporter NhaP n=1 Tax=Duganella phyllosphaerae TaxID=762836 RepID=A0A1E7X4W1_9BURK|nr:sodium:proton antiporter [Duganella phyllosphaerae]OFA07626.1 K(+)/H(+) antiporter NhaP [Duganella phyllosphaerae]
MQSTHWFILIGLLMLARGMAATTISRSPFTSAIVYLGVGLVLGPTVLNLFHFEPSDESGLLEVLTEVAILVSLFSAGIKMPVPFRRANWDAPLRLAWISMIFTVVLVAAFGFFVLGLPVGAAILLGGILAPTDPVLATDVQIRHAGDTDRLRFTLTCEAGMNDGSAAPFVFLGLGVLGLDETAGQPWRWLFVDVFWAALAAVAIGVFFGAVTARLTWRLRMIKPRHDIMDDLVGLGLIAVAYGVATLVHAWGFLAVFFAAVALRQTELMMAGAPKDQEGLLEPDTGKSQVALDSDSNEAPMTVSTESLVFKEHLERLSELTLVVLLGGMISLQEISWQAVFMAAFLFFIARPVAVFLGLAGSAAPLRLKAMTAWFGIRGIGSIYYLVFAIEAGLAPDLAAQLTNIVLFTIMLSIVVHGLSVKPLMNTVWRE